MRFSPPSGSDVILLAASDVFVRNLLSRALTREGYFVLDAANCDEALHLSIGFEGKIDLLLASSDIPGRMTFTEAIVRERPRIRVLVISLATQEDLIQRSKEHTRWPRALLPEELKVKIRRATTDPPFGATEI